MTGPLIDPALLGRRPEFDHRSRAFPVRADAAPTLPPRSYTWSCPVVLDQGARLDGWWKEGGCTGYSAATAQAARPRQHAAVSNELGRDLYRAAQDEDEWDGADYEGSSVLGAAKAARKLGLITEYRWAFGLADLIYGVGHHGPAILGIDWYEAMFGPDAQGFVAPGGAIAGGHAICAIGVSLAREAFRFRQTWGPDWGLDGDCWMSFATVEQLLHQQGEAVFVTKPRPRARKAAA